MSTSANVSIPASINATMTPSELLTALLAMSSNVTPTSVLDAVEKLPTGVPTNKLGVLSVQASMSIKKVVDKVASAAGLTLSDDWKVNSTVNFSMIAMVGHMIFLLPDSALTPTAMVARTVYSKSLGGARDLKSFGTAGVVPAKAKRTTILREWSERLKDADLARAHKVFAAKFPLLVKPVGNPASNVIAGMFSIPSRAAQWALSATLAPIRLAYALGGPYVLVALLYLFPATRPLIFLALEGALRIAANLFRRFQSLPSVKPYAAQVTEAVTTFAASMTPEQREVVAQALNATSSAYDAVKSFNTTAIRGLATELFGEVKGAAGAIMEALGDAEV